MNDMVFICKSQKGWKYMNQLKELRCICKRLLGKCNGQAEVVCPRCGKTMTFDNGKVVFKSIECK